MKQGVQLVLERVQRHRAFPRLAAADGHNLAATLSPVNLAAPSRLERPRFVPVLAEPVIRGVQNQQFNLPEPETRAEINSNPESTAFEPEVLTPEFSSQEFENAANQQYEPDLELETAQGFEDTRVEPVETSSNNAQNADVPNEILATPQEALSQAAPSQNEAPNARANNQPIATQTRENPINQPVIQTPTPTLSTTQTRVSQDNQTANPQSIAGTSQRSNAASSKQSIAATSQARETQLVIANSQPENLDAQKSQSSELPSLALNPNLVQNNSFSEPNQNENTTSIAQEIPNVISTENTQTVNIAAESQLEPVAPIETLTQPVRSPSRLESTLEALRQFHPSQTDANQLTSQTSAASLQTAQSNTRASKISGASQQAQTPTTPQVAAQKPLEQTNASNGNSKIEIPKPNTPTIQASKPVLETQKETRVTELPNESIKTQNAEIAEHQTNVPRAEAVNTEEIVQAQAKPSGFAQATHQVSEVNQIELEPLKSNSVETIQTAAKPVSRVESNPSEIPSDTTRVELSQVEPVQPSLQTQAAQVEMPQVNSSQTDLQVETSNQPNARAVQPAESSVAASATTQTPLSEEAREREAYQRSVMMRAERARRVLAAKEELERDPTLELEADETSAKPSETPQNPAPEVKPALEPPQERSEVALEAEQETAPKTNLADPTLNLSPDLNLERLAENTSSELAFKTEIPTANSRQDTTVLSSPTNPGEAQTFNSSEPRTLNSSKPRTSNPSELQTSNSSNAQTLNSNKPQTLNSSELQTSNSKDAQLLNSESNTNSDQMLGSSEVQTLNSSETQTLDLNQTSSEIQTSSTQQPADSNQTLNSSDIQNLNSNQTLENTPNLNLNSSPSNLETPNSSGNPMSSTNENQWTNPNSSQIQNPDSSLPAKQTTTPDQNLPSSFLTKTEGVSVYNPQRRIQRNLPKPPPKPKREPNEAEKLFAEAPGMSQQEILNAIRKIQGLPPIEDQAQTLATQTENPLAARSPQSTLNARATDNLNDTRLDVEQADQGLSGEATSTGFEQASSLDAEPQTLSTSGSSLTETPNIQTMQSNSGANQNNQVSQPSSATNQQTQGSAVDAQGAKVHVYNPPNRRVVPPKPKVEPRKTEAEKLFEAMEVTETADEMFQRLKRTLNSNLEPQETEISPNINSENSSLEPEHLRTTQNADLNSSTAQNSSIGSNQTLTPNLPNLGSRNTENSSRQVQPSTSFTGNERVQLSQNATRFLKPIVGIDPNEVKIYRDPQTERLTKAARADALTVGDTVLLSNEQALDSPQTLGLIAHELTHVARNRQARFVPPIARDNHLAASAQAGNEEGLALGIEAFARQGWNHFNQTANQNLPTQTSSSATAANRSSYGGLPAPADLPSWFIEDRTPPQATSRPAPRANAPESTPFVPQQAPTNAVADSVGAQAASQGRDVPTPPPAAGPLPASQQPKPEPSANRAAPDLDAMARQVYTILKRRLANERHRM